MQVLKVVLSREPQAQRQLPSMDGSQWDGKGRGVEEDRWATACRGKVCRVDSEHYWGKMVESLKYCKLQLLVLVFGNYEYL